MRLRRALAAAAGALVAGAQAQAQVVHTLPPVEVIQQTPLPGLEVPRSLYPGNAQPAATEEFRYPSLNPALGLTHAPNEALTLYALIGVHYAWGS